MIAVLLHPVTILLATLCLQWVALGSAGFASLQVPYLALALVALFSVSGPHKLAMIVEFAKRNAIWIVPLGCYLLIVGVVLTGSPVETMVPRQIFFLVGTVALAACVARAQRVGEIFRVGGVLSVLLFIVAVELLAQSIDLSWRDALARFISGDFNFVIFSFFRGVFNVLDQGDVMLGAATKNIAAVSLLVVAMLVRAGSRNPSRDILGIGLLALTLGLLLMLNTRSVLIVAALMLLMATAVGAAIRPAHTIAPLIAKVSALVALLVVVVVLYLPELGVSTTLTDRFAFDDYSSSSRVEQFQVALQQIERHPLTGSGYFEVNGHVVHNLFLAAWVYGGIVTFLLAVAFYVALLAKWLATVVRMVSRPERWVLPVSFEWIAPLPILPLFRVWLSGDAGNLFLGEWVAVGAFFGFVLANEQMRRRIAAVQRGRQVDVGKLGRTYAV